MVRINNIRNLDLQHVTLPFALAVPAVRFPEATEIYGSFMTDEGIDDKVLVRQIVLKDFQVKSKSNVLSLTEHQ